MLSALLQPDIWASFLTLSVLEIVLGIDNIIFLSLVCAKLPKNKQPMARMLGLGLALVMRIGLLACIAWLAKLNKTVFTAMGQDISWRDIILAGGGLFLLYKATVEIHREVEGEEEDEEHKHKDTMLSVILQIVAIDLVLSLDSIFTAVGVADHLPVMIAAIVVAILVMLFASNPVADFVEAHPTVKMLALAFILLVGVVLLADAFEFHIPRGYLYFGIFFSLSVEGLNQLVHRKRHKRVSGGH
jgi:predicted tellurium resistance membrane protein TerC